MPLSDLIIRKQTGIRDSLGGRQPLLGEHTIMYRERHCKRILVKGRLISVQTGKGPTGTEEIQIEDTYLMKTAREGLAVFARKVLPKDAYVGIYFGELIFTDRLARFRLQGHSATHHISLCAYCLPMTVDGRPHTNDHPHEANGKRFDIEYFVKNGAIMSLVNAGTGRYANCTIEVFPRLQAGKTYGFLEVDGQLPVGTIPIWILLRTKEIIGARSQLRWDYPVDEDQIMNDPNAEYVDVDNSQTSVRSV